MNLKQIFLISISGAFLFITAWELYWRSTGLVPNIDDDKHLWAQERSKVDKLSRDDIILTGSSRVLFNIQLDEFEEEAGIRPLQLASAGSSPLPIFHDIVENTDFAGTIIVGVTPGLFFSSISPKAFPIQWPKERVDHFHSRSLADRLNHKLSIPLQENLVFLGTYDEALDNNVDLKTLLNRIEINNRTHKPRYPPFFDFGSIASDRNVMMTEKTSSDTAAANIIIRAWKAGLTADRPPPDKKGTISYFAEDVKKFIARGGTVIILRSPSTGMFKTVEAEKYSRATFYDSLMQVTQVPGYHYADHDQLKDYDCPEWSHLSAADAKTFTTDFVRILINDGHIKPQKNQ